MSYIDTKHPQFFAEASEMVKASQKSAQQNQSQGGGPQIRQVIAMDFGGQYSKTDGAAVKIWNILLENGRKMESDPVNDMQLPITVFRKNDIETLA